MSVILQELNGDSNLLLMDSEWGPILSLIRISEVLAADEAEWEEMRDGYVVNATEARQISKFVSGFLEDNAEAELFEIDESIPPGQDDITAGDGERTIQAAFAVSRKRMEAFIRFCGAVEGGFSIW